MEIAVARIVALLMVAILVAIVARRLSLPYTVGLVAAGIGLAISKSGIGLDFTHDFIFDVILPPLLFEAALNIHWNDLRREILPILTLSIFGVLISAAVVAAGMAWLLNWPAASALAFGVLIAATDPVAVIAMFKDTGIGGRLRLLVESESLFNDGVAAVLFGLVLTWAQADGSALAVTKALVFTSCGGIVIGVAAGGAAILIAWRTVDRLVETALTVVAAYGSFLLAAHFQCSGVLAAVSAGLVMGNLAVRAKPEQSALSADSSEFVVAFWDFAAFVANSLAFLLIGLAVAAIAYERLGFTPLLIAVALVLLGRAISVYPLCLLFRRSAWRIPLPEQHILWWGGLRGALALALSLALPTSVPLRDQILVATFGVVAFSVLIQGLTMPILLRKLGFLPSQIAP